MASWSGSQGEPSLRGSRDFGLVDEEGYEGWRGTLLLEALLPRPSRKVDPSPREDD